MEISIIGYIFTPFDDDYQTIEGHFYVYGDTRFGSLNLSDSGRIKYIKKSYRTVKAPKDMEILTYWEVKFYTAKNWTTYEPFQSDENYNYYKIPDGMNVVDASGRKSYKTWLEGRMERR